MTFEASARTPRAALALVAIVAFLVLLQLGAVISQVLADAGGGPASTAVVPDAVSDTVAATAAEFRVDESGAATYSIPLYAVPGTAGVAPKLSLNYSSQGGYGPLGKGWSIGGLSSISRCRATREAGDFIEYGVPTDGSPTPINYSATDRFCLDGQRLLPVQSGSSCPSAGGMSGVSYRTEIESFQRVCAYDAGDGNGPKFFTVDRKDGSRSWYGDRVLADTQNLTYNGYVNSTAPGKEAIALSWAQTRFQDSTGNYIDFVYWQDQGEHVITEVRYTGKLVLPGQSGSWQTPYAKIGFTYDRRAQSQWPTGYVAGGRVQQSYRVAGVTSWAEGEQQARHYRLSYSPSPSGSGLDTLISIQECKDTSAAVCLPATVFDWSQAKFEFATSENPPALPTGSISKFEGFKLGDVDGDGRQDIVYLKDGSSGESCPTEYVLVLFAVTDAAGNPTFTQGPATCTPGEIGHRGESGWHLFDYTGDGRDDLFVSSGPGQGWRLYPSLGRSTKVFDESQNLIAPLSPAIPSQDAVNDQVQLADFNGDGLTDIVYLSAGVLKARLMERQGGSFGWGAERVLAVDESTLPPQDPRCTNEPLVYDCWHDLTGSLTAKTGFVQLADFNGDAASDLLLQLSDVVAWDGGDCECPPGQRCTLPLSVSSAESDGTQAQMTSAASGSCGEQRDITVRLHAMTVRAISPTTITIGSYGYMAGRPHAISLADANGDGLTDLFTRPTSSSEWQYAINSGNGLQAPVVVPLLDFEEQVRLVDVNGDGRADILHLTNMGPYKAYNVKYALPSGGYGDEVWLPGATGRTGYAQLCTGYGCDHTRAVPMFGDFDADGSIDFISLWLDDNANVFLSRAGSRFTPRDVITKVTNGLGAETDIVYAPLTNAALYRRDTGTRNPSNWGRGAPVLDLLAPSYAVARVASSSPQDGAPTAKATVHYRYAGAKVQAGGRGFLGFREIVTIDPNQSSGYVTTQTLYNQNFPYVGMPAQTIKRAAVGASYAVPACLNGTRNDSCYATPGVAFTTPAGNPFSDSSQIWEADTEIASATVTAFAAGTQAPVHVRTAGTDENLRDPIGGAQTSRVVTTFAYAAYGNVYQTTVDTYTGASTLTATVITGNQYAADNPAAWRLGRLTASTVTHRRPQRPDVVRTTTFAYDMGAAVTGLLNGERIQPNLSVDQDLYKAYTLDDYGNRTRATTCAAPVLPCDPNGLLFHPDTPTTIKRTSRIAYDAQGRFPVATYELFWDGAGAVEREVQRVVARNLFGDVTQAVNVNGVDTLAVPGTFGRPYYSWTETVPGSVPGDPAGGVDSITSYRWCGDGGVDCPTGAKFRQKVLTEGAPTAWTYFDLLGRPILKAAETFNIGVSGKDVAAVCTAYDATGKPKQVSNPFFLAGTGGSDGPTGLASACSSGRNWTTTSYDVLGRPTRVTGPDNGVVDTSYSGLETTVTDRRRNLNQTTVQTRNGKGELTFVRDAVNSPMAYYYNADGTLWAVHRDAGPGIVVNAFTYDALGRKTSQNDPDTGYTRYEYNALGELTAQTDAADNRIEHEIDARGRVWRKTVKQAGSSVVGGSIESQSTYTFDTATDGLGQLAREEITGLYAAWSGATHLRLEFARAYSYDVLGRPLTTVTWIDNGGAYPTWIGYDALGRPFKAQDATSRWSKTEYNARGFGAAVCFSSAVDGDPSCGTSAWQRTQEMDAWGHTTAEVRSATGQLPVTRSYDPLTGRIQRICADKPGGASCELVQEDYAWDSAGNLSTQLKESRYLETFYYDTLNRLTRGYVSGSTLSYFAEFDALGNVCAKSHGDATSGRNYTYAGRAGCGLGNGANTMYGAANGDMMASPHQVLQVQGDASYSYDPRGNQTFKDAVGTANDRTISYSVDDHPYAIVKGNPALPSQVVRFWYGPDGQRYKREDVGGKRTLYLGNVEIVTEYGETTFKRYLGGMLLQTIVGRQVDNQYLFHDQLGSVVRITDAIGNRVSDMDFTPAGERRNFTNPTQYNGTAPSATTRGFTGHEMVDGLDVIHMNGRIYDPNLGRFLQADPVIQAPENSQSWNAYTYVFNNPLAYTDPTGMIGQKERMWAAVVFAIAYTYFTWDLNGGAGIIAAAAGGAIAGGIATGTWQGAMYGAFSAALFYGIGSYFQNAQWAQATAGNNAFDSGITWGAYGVKVLAHGVAGGVMSSLQGGKFGHGFAAAGVTQAFGPAIDRIPGGAGAKVAAAAILGGTASVLSGGKFANGAITAAFSRAFNEGMHPTVNKLSSRQKLELANLATKKMGEIRRMSSEEFLETFPDMATRVNGMDEFAIENEVYIAKQPMIDSLGNMQNYARASWAGDVMSDELAYGFVGMAAPAFRTGYQVGWTMFQSSQTIWDKIMLRSSPSVQIACNTSKGCVYNVR